MSTAAYIHGTTPDEQERLATLNRLTNAAFLDYLGLAGQQRVLEVGSGLGVLTGAVAMRLPSAYVLGVEYAAAQLARAPRTPAHLGFCRGDGLHLPVGTARFDLAYCRYLLEHVPNPGRVLAEMHRALRPGGRICLQENDILVVDFYPECPRFARAWRKFCRLQTRLGGDARVGRRLFPLLQAAGFEEIRLSLQPEVHTSGMESFEPWVENLRTILMAAGPNLQRHGLADAAELAAAAAELRAFQARGDATALFYWNRAAARR